MPDKVELNIIFGNGTFAKLAGMKIVEKEDGKHYGIWIRPGPYLMRIHGLSYDNRKVFDKNNLIYREYHHSIVTPLNLDSNYGSWFVDTDIFGGDAPMSIKTKHLTLIIKSQEKEIDTLQVQVATKDEEIRMMSLNITEFDRGHTERHEMIAKYRRAREEEEREEDEK